MTDGMLVLLQMYLGAAVAVRLCIPQRPTATPTVRHASTLGLGLTIRQAQQ
jgi:hypothetical protein